jgi:site-specific recombinase XerC
MFYSKDEMTRILDNPALSLRDRVIANLSLGCALRRCEIVGLSMTDVQLPEINLPQAIVKGGKTGRDPGRKFNVPIDER